ncbi:hypothetical protein N431DRAFT_457728 [Stipitochalara longipes BDJ]|nr:hypothetical protein N431DRAFT_457728 [Stipitochalara longipes BDJ]
MQTRVLEAFLIQISDQQLLLGLVVLICAFAEYYRSALGGNDNFWHAADVACFSMFSHAAMMLALRAFFREHQKLATARISLMVVVFGLWAIIGYYMLHPSGPYYKTTTIVRFWHSATYIEFVGVFWVYILTCVPIFISEEAISVGRAISSNDARCFFEESQKWKTYALTIIFNLLFSWAGIGVVVIILWLFTLSALAVGFFTSKREMGWDFRQLLSLAIVVFPLQSVPSAIASEQSSRRSRLS